ncbi:hypothetical protein [Nodosilinea nodulosa]|uniref:hypothetical protein n=1 Tax=Nodosilinea nodulosa TaxID=416001 RepID=UPI0003147FE6|nr:hypothetical protein [Nodosilinea nodulosa]
MFSPAQHPSRHVWDFWYHYDFQTKTFDVFYLNADKALVPSGQHHFSSRLGHATTSDFVSIDWGNDDSFDVLKPPEAHWANTSIWSGDIVKVKNGYLLFYTSRDRHQDDGMTQNIGVAYCRDLASQQWQIFKTQIQPKAFYEPKSLAGDVTIHAWRDPFLFRQRDEGQVYMLLSAKLSGGETGSNGAIALLAVSDQNFAQAVRGEHEWNYLPPLSQPGCYSEMEVPQLYKNLQGSYELVFSTWAKHDLSPTTNRAGGCQSIALSTLWKTKQDSITTAFSSQNSFVLMPEISGLYACRIIPELGGEIVGFDIHHGGIRRSGVKTNFKAVDRDFSDLTV